MLCSGVAGSACGNRRPAPVCNEPLRSLCPFYLPSIPILGLQGSVFVTCLPGSLGWE